MAGLLVWALTHPHPTRNSSLASYFSFKLFAFETHSHSEFPNYCLSLTHNVLAVRCVRSKCLFTVASTLNTCSYDYGASNKIDWTPASASLVRYTTNNCCNWGPEVWPLLINSHIILCMHTIQSDAEDSYRLYFLASDYSRLSARTKEWEWIKSGHTFGFLAVKQWKDIE